MREPHVLAALAAVPPPPGEARAKMERILGARVLGGGGGEGSKGGVSGDEEGDMPEDVCWLLLMQALSFLQVAPLACARNALQ